MDNPNPPVATPPAAAPPRPAISSSTLTIGAVVAAALGAVGVGTWLARSKRPPAPIPAGQDGTVAALQTEIAQLAQQVAGEQARHDYLQVQLNQLVAQLNTLARSGVA